MHNYIMHTIWITDTKQRDTITSLEEKIEKNIETREI